MVGYARVCTDEQDLPAQQNALSAMGIGLRAALPTRSDQSRRIAINSRDYDG